MSMNVATIRLSKNFVIDVVAQLSVSDVVAFINWVLGLIFIPSIHYPEPSVPAPHPEIIICLSPVHVPLAPVEKAGPTVYSFAPPFLFIDS